MLQKSKITELMNFILKELSEGKGSRELDHSILTFLSKKRAELKLDISRKEDELNLVNQFIDRYTEAQNLEEYVGFDGTTKFKVSDPMAPYVSAIDAHRTKDYWRKFAVNYLEKEGCFVSSKEIMNASHTPEEERRGSMSILSTVLSELVEHELIVRIKVEGDKGYYYAMPGTLPVIKS